MYDHQIWDNLSNSSISLLQKKTKIFTVVVRSIFWLLLLLLLLLLLCVFFIPTVLLQYWILFGCAFFFTSFFLYGPSVLYTNRKYDKIHTAHTFNDTIFDLFIILSSNLSRLYGFLRLNMLFHTKIISSVIIDWSTPKKKFIFLRNFCNVVVVVVFPSNWSEFHLEFTWLFLCDFFSVQFVQYFTFTKKHYVFVNRNPDFFYAKLFGSGWNHGRMIDRVSLKLIN